MKKLTLYRVIGKNPSGKSPKKLIINKWNKLPWAKIRERVIKLQRVIYKASLEGNIKKVRRYQNLVINSTSAKFLAVRRITQDNQGKKTAGVDGIRNLLPAQRLYMVSILSIPTRSKPLRRIWFPKPGTDVKRPIGIPTIHDRCLQALFKLALEPEWEAKFEPNSYGFRPGRNAHDALAAIQAYIQKRSKYVLDADISKCFDTIDHSRLLDKIGIKGKFRKQLAYWLKSGVLDAGTFSETEMGTPQGGIISPLLANIALHGMEFHLQEFVKQFPMTYASGKPIGYKERAETLGLVRYADDFVVLHPDKKVLLACYTEIQNWLKHIGLTINASKTRLTHTLELQKTDTESEGFDGKVGFNFLGYTIKQFKSKYRSAKNTKGVLLGYKTLIYPSKKSINNHQDKLHRIILIEGKGMTQKALIKKLNPVIRGWSNYFGAFDSNSMGFLKKMDHLTYLKTRKWSNRIKGSTAKGLSCFHTIENRKWKFSIINGPALVDHSDYSTPNSEITKIRGSESPYSPNKKYWAKRQSSNLSLNSRARILFGKQKGVCTWCKRPFYWDDIKEVDHIIPLLKGGEDNIKNLQLLHRHCHASKTAVDAKRS
uniref:Putative HNH endonuclease n=1 Tax=Lobochlamys culleus TaxID=51693 RepID=A0A0S2ICZ8_9CHLO|nr:putative HNH endonuclease [Lobochlamys culleus]